MTMWPDLGRYVFTVLGAYGAGLALMAAVVVLSLWRARAAKRALADAEARSGRATPPPARPAGRAPERAGDHAGPQAARVLDTGKGARHG